MDIDTKELETLLEGKKFDEAKKIIEDYLASSMSPEEIASAHLDFATLYMQVMNKINDRYIASLEALVGDLEDLNKAEKGSKNRLDLAEVRASL